MNHPCPHPSHQSSFQRDDAGLCLVAQSVLALMVSTTAAVLDTVVTVGKIVSTSRDHPGANTIALLYQAFPRDVAPCLTAFFVIARTADTTVVVQDIAVTVGKMVSTSRDHPGANTIALLYQAFPRDVAPCLTAFFVIARTADTTVAVQGIVVTVGGTFRDLVPMGIVLLYPVQLVDVE
mmetsp:Transcript_16747/g.40824  ORF Transcript_16747/g.40824 Transcript_16747/m.40824 type:complete len:179 (-) Transcript_16747:195-731(-)